MVRSSLICMLMGLLVIVPFVAVKQASAQAVYGSILGTVTDPQGAAVAGAKITVTNQRKGTSDTTTTNESGNYSVTHLVPDTYTLRVEGPGFKVIEQKEIIVSADAGSRVDAQFQVGSTSESIEVTAEAPQLKTDRADVAVQFNEKYVEDLPILNRNFTSFQLLSPGSQKLVGWSHAATENPQGGQQVYKPQFTIFRSVRLGEMRGQNTEDFSIDSDQGRRLDGSHPRLDKHFDRCLVVENVTARHVFDLSLIHI